MRMRALIVAGVVLGGLVSDVDAQRRGGFFSAACRFSSDDQNYFVSPYFRGNPRYSGRVTFARIKYQGAYECGGEGPGWSHDYPRTESHFVRILRELSTIRPFIEQGPIIGSVLVRLDEPEL